MASMVAVYDACVLYSAPLRDLLMQIALTDMIQAKWTEAIHDEWTQSLLQSRPDLKPEHRRQRASLKNPPKTVEELLTILAQQRLPQTVSSLQSHLDDI